MQKLIAILRLGKDATVTQLQTTQVINFSAVHNDKIKDKSTGQYKDVATWFECSYYTDKVGVAQYLKKGTECYFEGTVGTKLYQPDNGGDPKAILTLRIHSIQLLGSNSSSNEGRVERQNTSSEDIKADGERF
jgi:single-strand DNA-binding protein